MSQENKTMSSDSFNKQHNIQTQPKDNTNRDNRNNNNNRSGQRNSSNYNNDKKKVSPKLIEILKTIKEKGYCEKDSNILRKDLLSREANIIVQELNNITKTQLRSFFSEAKKLSFKYENI